MENSLNGEISNLEIKNLIIRIENSVNFSRVGKIYALIVRDLLFIPTVSVQ